MLKLLSLIVLPCATAMAQMPDTDIWIFQLKKNKEGKLIVSKGINATNRAGYDNQPAFSADEKYIYYTSVREDGQADIYSMSVSGDRPKKITSTFESEYSARPTSRKNELSCVTVEKDSSQRIHLIDLATNTRKALEFDSVGYYTFLNQDTVIYYKLTSPHSLRFFVQSSGEDKFICHSPARGLSTINRHSFAFGVKDSSMVGFYIYDFLLRKAVKQASYPTMSEDLNWHADYGLMKSEDNRILLYSAEQGKWIVLLDLNTFGLKKTGRFIIDSKSKYLVLVNNK